MDIKKTKTRTCEKTSWNLRQNSLRNKESKWSCSKAKERLTDLGNQSRIIKQWNQTTKGDHWILETRN